MTERHAEATLVTATALNPHIGYDKRRRDRQGGGGQRAARARGRAREGRRREDARRGARPREDGEGEHRLDAVRSRSVRLAFSAAWPTSPALLEDPLAHRALDALVRAETRLTRAARARPRAHWACPPPASRCWSCCSRRAARSSCALLRQRLGISKANASEVAATLVARGLVDRRRSPRDRRAVTLWLTPAGERAGEELFPDHAGRVRDAFAPLEADEKRELARLCRKLDRRR